MSDQQKEEEQAYIRPSSGTHHLYVYDGVGHLFTPTQLISLLDKMLQLVDSLFLSSLNYSACPLTPSEQLW